MEFEISPSGKKLETAKIMVPANTKEVTGSFSHLIISSPLEA
jgi:hypothetical protein